MRLQIDGVTYSGRRLPRAIQNRVVEAMGAIAAPGNAVEVAIRTGWHPVDARRYLFTVVADFKLKAHRTATSEVTFAAALGRLGEHLRRGKEVR